MARRTGLREFQLAVAERLRTAATTKQALSSKLGFQVGGENWFVALHQVSEVIPVPQSVPVPLTHSWFRGVANVRGTETIVGRGITSLTWCSATNQFSLPTWNPSRDESAVRELAVRSLSATDSWNSRRPVRLAIVVAYPSAAILAMSSLSFTGLVT